MNVTRYSVLGATTCPDWTVSVSLPVLGTQSAVDPRMLGWLDEMASAEVAAVVK